MKALITVLTAISASASFAQHSPTTPERRFYATSAVTVGGTNLGKNAAAGAPTTATILPLSGIGLMYLSKSYASEPPINPATVAGVTNAHMKGILWRETWERLDRNGQGNHDWTFLDACFDASDSHDKDAALQILAGNFAPAWFFSLPNAKQITSSGLNLPTTIPWDPVFQTEWEAVQTQMANRYKSHAHLRYVVIAGPGHGSESFFATHPEEFTQANDLAVSMGYSGCDEAWRAGVTWLIDMYARVWSPIPVVLCTGTPYADTNGGTAALQAMFDYGDASHRGEFGARADDLSANGPTSGQPSATIIQQISPHCMAVGYQLANHQNANDTNPPTRLDQALNRGTGFGAHFIEVFADDADAPVSGPALDAANVRLLATLSIARSGTNVVLTWSLAGTLQYTPVLSFPTIWSNLPLATNPYPFTSTNQQGFYRLNLSP